MVKQEEFELAWRAEVREKGMVRRTSSWQKGLAFGLWTKAGSAGKIKQS